ncbi:hypothetical protein ACFX2B_013182 [Malus domestica]
MHDLKVYPVQVVDPETATARIILEQQQRRNGSSDWVDPTVAKGTHQPSGPIKTGAVVAGVVEWDRADESVMYETGTIKAGGGGHLRLSGFLSSNFEPLLVLRLFTVVPPPNQRVNLQVKATKTKEMKGGGGWCGLSAQLISKYQTLCGEKKTKAVKQYQQQRRRREKDQRKEKGLRK